MKKQFALLLLFIWLLFPQTAFAVRNVVISSNKLSIDPGEEIIILSSVSGFENGEKIYLKGAFFKDGTSNYFGLTKFNDVWIKNGVSALSQKEILIGAWDNTTIIKPDYEDTGFSGNGDYKFKLGFYYLTSGGNVSSINWSSNDLSMSLIAPSVIPEDKEEKISPVKSSSIFSKTPTVTKSISPTPTYSSKKTASFAKISLRPKTASEFAQIKPITRKGKENVAQVLGAKDAKFPSFIFIGGITLLLLAGFMFGKKQLKERGVL